MSGFMGYIGFFSGVLMGMITRDNYQYSMGEKMDAIA
jgi:hypothetical protein